MAQQRIYLVTLPDGEARLVKASARSQALAHVANKMFGVKVASQDDLVSALNCGLKVEHAIPVVEA